MAAPPTDPAVPAQGAPPHALDAAKREPVPLALLVQRSTSEAFSGLQQMCKALPGRGEKERKLALLKYLVKTRQRLLRLHAVTEWAKQVRSFRFP
jgi:mediator of RNA polymerase II transcription subunit 14